MTKGCAPSALDGLVCPACGDSRSEVKDSRASGTYPGTRRRRRCSGCGARFQTIELAVADDLFVSSGNIHHMKTVIGVATAAMADLQKFIDTLALFAPKKDETDGA